MSKATVLRMLAAEAEATATRTGRRDYRLAAADLYLYAARAEATARAAARRKRKSRSRRLGAGQPDEQTDLEHYLEVKSQAASCDKAARFTGSGPSARRTLREVSHGKA